MDGVQELAIADDDAVVVARILGATDVIRLIDWRELACEASEVDLQAGRDRGVEDVVLVEPAHEHRVRVRLGLGRHRELEAVDVAALLVGRVLGDLSARAASSGREKGRAERQSCKQTRHGDSLHAYRCPCAADATV